jgi:osmotically inducible protein OsmC
MEVLMPDIKRQASVAWEGSLTEGQGTLSVTSGVLQDVPVSWGARTESQQPVTSPEELIAAAHSSCYAMALSHVLSQAGHKPDRLAVSSDVSAELGPDGLKIKASRLSVRGRVPGIDQATFEQLARQGEASCPVSAALRGNLEITVEAVLDR